MIEFDLIDTLMDVLYAVAGLALLYVGIQLVRDEFKARKGNNAAPYKVPAPVATAPLGRKRASKPAIKQAKKPVAKKTTQKRTHK